MLAYHPDRLDPGVTAIPESRRDVDRAAQVASGKEEAQSATGADIRLINEARWVLGDPERRRQWEEEFKRESAPPTLVCKFTRLIVLGSIASTPSQLISRSPHVYREISLELFEPHFNNPAHNRAYDTPSRTSSSDTVPTDGSVQDDIPAYYTYPCRCSHLFRISHDDLEAGVEVIGCEGCGEWIRVGYESVEVDEQLDAWL